jgi:hypothetical protein
MKIKMKNTTLLLVLAILLGGCAGLQTKDSISPRKTVKVVPLTENCNGVYFELYVTDRNVYIRTPFAPYVRIYRENTYNARIAASGRLRAEVVKLSSRPSSFFRSNGLRKITHNATIYGSEAYLHGEYMVMPLRGITIRPY